MKSFSKTISVISIISGTIIGVGLFALPYITLQVGFWTMLFYFLFLGLVAIIVHLFFVDVSVKTPDLKRFPSFAKIHLGSTAEKIAFFSTIFGIIGTLLSYLIIGGGFLNTILNSFGIGENSFWGVIIFFILAAGLIFFDIKYVSSIEFWGLVLFILILGVLFFVSVPHLNVDNLFIGKATAQNIFLPYGAVLFSLWGAALIPEAEEMLDRNKKKLKKIVALAILIPIVVYLFFIFIILGVCGKATTESAMVCLNNFLPQGILNLSLFFGFLTCFTSFITMGLTLKKVFWFDLKINKNVAWAITCFIPLILYFLGVQNFIQIISILGGVLLAIDGILIILMHRKVNPQKFRVLRYFLIAIFVIGIIYEIVYFIK
ncbi:MAG: aromatic amino acid transport family protein [Candidatus Pacebacteria bacterium]|nr:aromatic amino acid transport family protein [Candidatus Paceibacterota bacterium]